MCVLRWSDRANFLWHVSHSKGFTPTHRCKRAVVGVVAQTDVVEDQATEISDFKKSRSKFTQLRGGCKSRWTHIYWSVHFLYLLQPMTSPSRCGCAALREVRVIAQIMHFFFSLSAMMMKSIYKEGNWEMEPDSQILHFHPSIFDLSLLYLLQGCWRPSRLTGVHPEQRVKPPDTTGYVLYKLLLLLLKAPGLSPVFQVLVWKGCRTCVSKLVPL